jgi:parvulin-like peptidyl-prolyl isomerase
MEDKLDQAVESEVQKFVSSFNGDYAAAEQRLAERNLTWKSFRDLQKRQILTAVYMQKLMGDPKPVTHNELVAFYDSIKDEEYLIPGSLQFSLIDIRPEAIDLADPNEDRAAAAAALAAEVAAMARAGQDFASLAKKYSQDPSREFGGLWEPVAPGSLARPYDILEKTVQNMEPNNIAGPIPVPEHFFIVKLEKKIPRGYRPFEEVQHEVETKLEEHRREQAFDSILQKRLDLTKFGDFDAFVQACVLAAYNATRQAAESASGGAE